MKRHWIRLTALLLGMQHVSAAAQDSINLVYNPSFEAHTSCPERIDALGIMRGVEAWWQPTSGSSDYFNACGGKETAVPRNKMGYQEAHSGNAYCGIYCSQEHYREYLQTELRQPLQAGKTYRISFWVSLADKASQSISAMGAMLTHQRLTDTTFDVLMQREYVDYGYGMQTVSTYYKPSIENAKDRPLDDSKGWQEVVGTYRATGGERYLTIGNFTSFNHSAVRNTGYANAVLQAAYYFIDDVSVICTDCDTPPTCNASASTPAAGDTVRLYEVLFDVDKSEILPQSYRSLQLLYELLNQNESIRIEIVGHTDAQGTQEHNRLLSEARAKAVADYLVQRGIEASRLCWRGMGESEPIDTNDTPEGRARNRRVEYRVL